MLRRFEWNDDSTTSYRKREFLVLFGILKSRFRILEYKMDVSPTMASQLATACAVLHNFLIDNNDDWARHIPQQGRHGGGGGDDSVDGAALRRFLMEHINNQ